MDSKDRVCIVTGGASGIGRVIAEALFRVAGQIAIWDSDVEAANRTAENLGAAVGRVGDVLAQSVDVARQSDVERAAVEVLDRFGKIDVLVNNAGVYSITPITDEDEASWDKIVDVNLKGAFLCIKAVLPTMIAQKYGKIVNISSISGKKQSIFASASYCSSKAGLIGLTRYVAAQVAPHGINVNCIAPALTRGGTLAVLGEERVNQALTTIPLGRMGEPEDIANAVLFLVSDASSFITGETLNVNGGSLME